jgi:hypothetical protein
LRFGFVPLRVFDRSDVQAALAMLLAEVGGC